MSWRGGLNFSGPYSSCLAQGGLHFTAGSEIGSWPMARLDREKPRAFVIPSGIKCFGVCGGEPCILGAKDLPHGAVRLALDLSGCET